MLAGSRLRLLSALAATMIVMTIASTPARAAPEPAAFDVPVDAYAAYVPQSTCATKVQPGAVALRDLIAARYPDHASFLMLRDCAAGGVSEHKEGRALDWMLEVDEAADDRVAWDFVNWLRESEGPEQNARMRRLGIMYVIWDTEILRAYRPHLGWDPYRGPNPHINHMHISLSWAGARKDTSWWTANR